MRTTRFEAVERLIRGYGYNANNLSMFLPHSRPTMKVRLETPGELTLYDIADIISDGQITFNDFVEAIRKDMP